MRNADGDGLHLARAVDEQFEDLWRRADTVNAKETPEWEQA